MKHTDAETQRNSINTQLQKRYKQKIWQEKQKKKRNKNVQTNHYETRNLQKLSSSYVGHLLLGMVILCLLEKTNFFFVNTYQLQIASGLGMVTCVYFSQGWEPINCLCEFICAPALLCLEGMCVCMSPANVHLPMASFSSNTQDRIQGPLRWHTTAYSYCLRRFVRECWFPAEVELNCFCWGQWNTKPTVSLSLLRPMVCPMVGAFLPTPTITAPQRLLQFLFFQIQSLSQAGSYPGR